MEHELLLFSSDSWTDAQLSNPCTPTVIQGFAEHVSLPTDDPIEDFSEVDMATGSMVSAGRSPNNILVLDQRKIIWISLLFWIGAADRFSACMDTKVDSMMDRLEKRIDEKIDSKLSPVMDRLSVLEKTSNSTRCGSSSLSDNGGSSWTEQYYWRCSLQYLLLLIWKSRVVRISGQKHTWTDRGSSQRGHHQIATGNWS